MASSYPSFLSSVIKLRTSSSRASKTSDSLSSFIASLIYGFNSFQVGYGLASNGPDSILVSNGPDSALVSDGSDSALVDGGLAFSLLSQQLPIVFLFFL